MDFLTTLDLATVDDEPFERRPPVGFRPCQRFMDHEGGQRVAREMTEALAEKCDTDDLARHSLHICLAELAENVLFHASTDLGGFMVAQGLKRKPEFEIGIADLGIGIRRSLSLQRNLASELALPGTLVALRARTDRPLNVQQAYELLEDDFNDSLRDRGFDDDDF